MSKTDSTNDKGATEAPPRLTKTDSQTDKDQRLTNKERAALRHHEATIESAQQAQLEAGRALRAINVQQLYRETHETFDAYCAERWGYTGRRAYHLISAADLIDHFRAVGVQEVPTCEAHARPLANLPEEDRVAVWEGVLAEHGADGVTKPAIDAAVKALKGARAAALAEDGTAEVPAVSKGLQATITADAATCEGTTGGTTDRVLDSTPGGGGAGASASPLIRDIGILGDEPPVIEPNELGSLVVSVPSTLYLNASQSKPYVLTTLDEFEASLGRPLDRELIRKVRDEIERLGYKPRFNETNDSIDWAGLTWNPVTGCKHGCVFCYAREVAHVFKRHYPQGFRPTLHPGRLLAPANTPLPPLDPANPGARHVFIDSMGDMYAKYIPDAFIEEVIETIRRHPEWTFKVLTKYPRRLGDFEYPENLWVGTSVVSQNYVGLAEEAMSRVRAAVRWVSCEPLLGPVEFSRPELFDLFVIGAQTAANGLPAFQPEAAWVDALKGQARSVGAKVFEKANLHVHLREFPTPKPERLTAEQPTAAKPTAAKRNDARGDGQAGEAPSLAQLRRLAVGG